MICNLSCFNGQLNAPEAPFPGIRNLYFLLPISATHHLTRTCCPAGGTDRRCGKCKEGSSIPASLLLILVNSQPLCQAASLQEWLYGLSGNLERFVRFFAILSISYELRPLHSASPRAPRGPSRRQTHHPAPLASCPSSPARTPTPISPRGNT